MLLLTSVTVLAAFAGCRHHCKKDSCCDGTLPPPGARGPINLPPPGVPTTPIPPPAFPGPAPSGYPPGAPRTGPEVLFPDPLPGSSSARPAQPGAQGYLGAPVKPLFAEPPKAPAAGAAGVPGYMKVKDGFYAGGKPTLDGFDALKKANFRTVIYLHASGADVSAVKDMASTRGLNFVAIETTPETLADAVAQFNRTAADRLTRPAYVFADDAPRAGAVWYLHFRTAEALGDDVARLRSKPLGLTEQGDEGRAFALAIQRVLETK
jgi:hypothetical protein